MKLNFVKRGILLLSVTGVFFLLITLLLLFTKEQAASNTLQTGNDNSIAAPADASVKTPIDYETLGIQEYEYPPEFSLGDNLRDAIIELAIRIDDYGRETVDSEWWQEAFLDCFIQNSRMSFDYLNMTADRNNGEVSVDELNYMQYSLTGVWLDFSSYGPVNRYDCASGMNGGEITDWDYTVTEDGVTVNADLEVITDGLWWAYDCKITANLIKDPYSCFDGYNVASLSLKFLPARFQPGMHVFYGSYLYEWEETDGIFSVEFSSCTDDVHYDYLVDLDLTASPKLADFARENIGNAVKVTYILGMGETDDPIENVVPINIEPDDRED